MDQQQSTNWAEPGLAGRSAERASLRVAVVSTYSPRQCGIATFAANLASALRQADPGLDLQVAAIENLERMDLPIAAARWRIAQGDRASFLETAAALNHADIDVVCVQHEFGLYGTFDGEYHDHLGPFLAALRIPAVTTLHTVLPAPSLSIRAAVRNIAANSATVVVMTNRAKQLLTTVYGVRPEKIGVVPHGVPVMTTGGDPELRRRMGLTDRTVISTFGLVDPRKGIEFMVEAMDTVRARHPEAIYLILGRTHPELVAREGQRYRASLEQIVQKRQLGEHVRLVDEYFSEQEIVDYLAATDIYVTPYLDADQITSGTLAYALGAGKAIVSTPYLHAVEALAEERGLLADFRSPSSLSAAVFRIMDEPGLRDRLERNAHEAGRRTTWPTVGADMVTLLRGALAGQPGVRLLQRCAWEPRPASLVGGAHA